MPKDDDDDQMMGRMPIALVKGRTRIPARQQINARVNWDPLVPGPAEMEAGTTGAGHDRAGIPVSVIRRILRDPPVCRCFFAGGFIRSATIRADVYTRISTLLIRSDYVHQTKDIFAGRFWRRLLAAAAFSEGHGNTGLVPLATRCWSFFQLSGGNDGLEYRHSLSQ